MEVAAVDPYLPDGSLFFFRIEYNSLFGSEFAEIIAPSMEEAYRIFWQNKNPELYRVWCVTKVPISPMYEKCRDCAQQSDHSCFKEADGCGDEGFSDEVGSLRSRCEHGRKTQMPLFSSGLYRDPRRDGLFVRIKHKIMNLFGLADHA